MGVLNREEKFIRRGGTPVTRSTYIPKTFAPPQAGQAQGLAFALSPCFVPFSFGAQKGFAGQP